jgi:tripartite-type tricarboxylate transporter receptor subunit TctC
VTTATRAKVLPNVPTLAESGVKGYDVSIWTGLVAPKGTPEATIGKLRAALQDVLKDKEVAERMESLGMEPGHVDANAFSKLIATDLARWGAVAKASNIKAD